MAKTAQLGIALDAARDQRLFGEHVLDREPPTWQAWSEPRVQQRFERVLELWRAARSSLSRANEAQTEERFIRPVLEALGHDYEVQLRLRAGGRDRQPDYGLFPSAAARDRARAATEGRWAEAVAVCDAKRFARPLDGRVAERDGSHTDDPVSQIIEYVVLSRTRWGILTNGRRWRLYAAEGDMAGGATLEIDLQAILQAEDLERFRLFATLFSAEAFRPDANGRSRLDRLLDTSRAGAVEVGDRLRGQVFEAVPLVARGLLGSDEWDAGALEAAFDNSLVVVFRMLFCLNAEQRGLLPADDEHYRGYGLQQLRHDLAERTDRGQQWSERAAGLWERLLGLFRLVDQGDPALGVNEYDGGLFDPDRHPWLAGRVVRDHLLAPALDRLFRVGGQQVDYRELSIRHLGSIFEQLLAWRLAVTEEGVDLVLEPADGRKRTGANFTPEHVVDAIVERTLSTLIDARSARVRDEGLAGEAALDEFLDLHVVDPAMGSGHFLLGAASYVARRIATDAGYDGALSLDDLTGLVAERCLYGVDVNPMAVEVARLALWLATVRDDRPLRFLGNLRHGNALVQADTRALLEPEQAGLLPDDLPDRARDMLARTAALRDIDARTAGEAHTQADLDREREAIRVRCSTRPTRRCCPRSWGARGDRCTGSSSSPSGSSTIAVSCGMTPASTL